MRKPSPATAISLVALFFSLTGAGFAASRYLITSKSQIKPNVLRSLTGPQGLQGQPGAQGIQGAQGPQGAAGKSPDISHATYVRTDASLDSTHPTAHLAAECPAGTFVLNGGYTGQNVIVDESFTADPTVWTVSAHLNPAQVAANPNEAVYIQARVTCVP